MCTTPSTQTLQRSLSQNNLSLPTRCSSILPGDRQISANRGNQVAIMLNGVSVFSGYADGVAATTYETSATYLEGSSFDLCGWHSTFDRTYHYHNTPGCLQEQAMSVAGTTTSDHTPQLGWSYDGFPIYGQLGPDGVEMLLCGSDEAQDTYCLDSCGGYEGEPSDVAFHFLFVQTCGFDEAFFPFTTNCYRGCCPTGETFHEYVEACGSSATAGYTDDYTAAVVRKFRVEVEYFVDGRVNMRMYCTTVHETSDTLWWNNRSAATGTAPDDDEDGSNGATASRGAPPLLFLATSLALSDIASMRAFACIL
ncbi:unnamed protein product [Ectocarpus sp. 12 AP-2014]